MFKNAVLRLYQAFIGSNLVRYRCLPTLAPYATVTTKNVADTYGDWKEIDDGTGTGVTGAYDGEAWIAGISVAAPQQATEYYDIDIGIGAAGHEVVVATVPIFAETTVPADTHAIFWLPKPLRIGAVPARLAVRAADLNAGAKTILAKLLLEFGL